jgi:hypothetical protein
MITFTEPAATTPFRTWWTELENPPVVINKPEDSPVKSD